MCLVLFHTHTKTHTSYNNVGLIRMRNVLLLIKVRRSYSLNEHYSDLCLTRSHTKCYITTDSDIFPLCQR